MRAFCDLHTHSCYSDGSCTPAQVVALAAEAGLAAVALTDHNTLEGLPEFLAAAEGQQILAVPGIEISAGVGAGEVHILGLFLPRESWPAVEAFVGVIRRRKEESNRLLAENLNRAGYRIDYPSILKHHPRGTVNRVNFARALMEGGYVPEIREAFATLLKQEAGYFIPPERVKAVEVIRFLRMQGAVPVLAHPLLSLSPEALEEFLPEAKQAGLAAMETRYGSYNPEQTRLAEDIARRFGIGESGGSDFHGSNRPRIALGTGRGELRVPVSFLEGLK